MTQLSDEVVGWQPIETAPKDGSFFLGWLVCAGMGQPEAMNWYENTFRFTDGGRAIHVSHWMPLPEPPTDEAKGDIPTLR